MPNQIHISPVNAENREAIISLLRSENLPVADLATELPNFFAATDNGAVIGVVGLETYERNGLLRSLAVKPEYRNMKIAAALVAEVEKVSRHCGLDAIYLLTETAKDYFLRKGFMPVDRTDAPEPLKQSSEFNHVCPASAILMKKALL